MELDNENHNREMVCGPRWTRTIDIIIMSDLL